MKKITLFALISLQFLPAICAAYPLSDTEKKDIENFLSQTIYWQEYWFNIWSEKDFGEFIKNKTIEVFIAPEKNSPNYSKLYVNGLNTVFNLNSDGKNFLCYEIIKSDTKAGFESEKKVYGVGGDDFHLKFENEAKNILDFGPFDQNKINFLKTELLKILDKNMQESIAGKPAGKAHTVINLKVGNFNRNYPEIYFYVIGMPSYLGHIYFNITTGEILDKDLQYTGDVTPKEYLWEIKRIDETGIIVKFDNGKIKFPKQVKGAVINCGSQ